MQGWSTYADLQMPNRRPNYTWYDTFKLLFFVSGRGLACQQETSLAN